MVTPDFLETLPPLFPMDFLEFRGNIPYAEAFPKKHIFSKNFYLQAHADFLDEIPFAKIALLWNEENLLIEAVIDKPFEEANYPDYRLGDSVELFFDTRDLKNSFFTHRFCHHFLILPTPVQEIGSCEITRFRTEDQHPLCDPDQISTKAIFESKRYRLHITINAAALHGYDPRTFDRLGFTYRINRPKMDPQHFVLSARTCAIEQHPNLWASMQMTNSKR